jgi:hypothetical protein
MNVNTKPQYVCVTKSIGLISILNYDKNWHSHLPEINLKDYQVSKIAG